MFVWLLFFLACQSWLRNLSAVVVVVVVDIVVGVLRWLLIFVAAIVAVFPLPQLPFSSCRWGWEWGMGITSASLGMWKCCCNFCCCCCWCCCCCCILLCLVYCTNARFGSGLHSQWGDSLCLAYTRNGGEPCVSNPVIDSNWSVCGTSSLWLASFVALFSQFASLKTHLNQRQHPFRLRVCSLFMPACWGDFLHFNRRHQSKRFESQASVSVSVSGLSPRLLHSVICFAV